MTTLTKINVGLTQFIDFTIKGSNAKINMVRKIKYKDDYHPAFDYWKQLRDAIINFHEKNLSSDFFDTLVQEVDTKKRENYTFAIKQYLKFIRNKNIEWFDPGKAVWSSNELVVRSSPELGLLINGEPYLIKLYFKGIREKVTKINSRSILALLNTSTFELNHSEDIHHSVLNIQRNNFITDNKINEDQLIALQSEATQFVYIWNNI